MGKSVPANEGGLAGTPTSGPLRILVGGREPLERELARFFLEEAGCLVVGKVSGAVDAVNETVQRQPDAVVLFESVVQEDVGLLRAIHRGSPSTKIAVIAPCPEEAWSHSSRGADAFVKEWTELPDLPSVLLGLCGGAREMSDPLSTVRLEPMQLATVDTGGAEVVAIAQAGHRTPWLSGRWYARLQGAVAVSLLFVAVFIGGGFSHPAPPASEREASASAPIHLHRADSTLETLIESMRDGSPPEVIVHNARTLITERAAAAAAGADVTELDAAIKAEVPSLLSGIPTRAAVGVVSILGALVRSHGPPSSPPASQGPEPSPAPSPTESPSPQPSPTESPSPEPSPTESPSPQPSAPPIPGTSPQENPGVAPGSMDST